MALSCGDDVGITWMMAAVPLALDWAGDTDCTPGSSAIASSSGARAAAGTLSSSIDSSRGPLKPGPKPSPSRSYARRVVSVSEAAPLSVMPRRKLNSGAASRPSATIPPIR